LTCAAAFATFSSMSSIFCVAASRA